MVVCKGCGRTIQKDFCFCPWCGESRASDKKESLELLFNKFTEEKRSARREQLFKMDSELDALERELSVLVLSTEMHK